MRRRSGLFALVAAGVAALVAAGVLASAFPIGGGSSSAVIGFEQLLGDAEVAALVERYGLEPRAVYLWTSGLSGTYRTYEELDWETFAAEARGAAIESFENGLAANLMRLELFVEQYSGDDVARDPVLAAEARSLLRIRRELADALRAARRRAPLAFALEVSGSSARLAELGRDPRVTDVRRSLGPLVPSSIGLKPPALERERRIPGIERMGAAEAYREIAELVRRENR